MFKIEGDKIQVEPKGSTLSKVQSFLNVSPWNDFGII